MSISKVIVVILSSLAAVVSGQRSCRCNDSPPDPNPGEPQYSCEDQKEWGKCNRDWMQGFCQCACGVCDYEQDILKGDSCGCNNSPPPGETQYSCKLQKLWGHCGAEWMKGYCECTCGTCASTLFQSDDTSPSPQNTKKGKKGSKKRGKGKNN
eukprot:TRINITY_DN7854_c0_g3_i2.p3 TRINITY_DN7854_c0_g3~~TRINITY_DN7854_c0_g3_i2.p3  ORF type:complete len:153 (-),score=24.56 TRINITY_DN7854_c0_g3_i2:1128-1586(-)